MPSVGDFTPSTNHQGQEPDTFTFFGETFEIPAQVGAGAALRFTAAIKQAQAAARRGEAAARQATTQEALERAQTVIREADADADVAIFWLFTAVLGEEQLGRFLDAADRHGADSLGLLRTCQQIQAVIADRPTRRSTDSSDGPSTSGGGSMAGGSTSTVQALRPPTRPTPTGETPLPLTPMQQQMAYIEAHSVPVR